MSRKRPRLDDQIDEYRNRAAKRHAEFLANTLAESADAASAELVSRKRPDNGVKETMKTVQTYIGNEEKNTSEDNMP